MKKQIIIVLAIGVPVLLGIYLYRKNKIARPIRTRRTGTNTRTTGTNTRTTGTNTGTTENQTNRQQIYNLQQGQILRDKFIAGGILKESEMPN